MPPRRTPSRLALWSSCAILAALLLSFLWVASIGIALLVGIAVAAVWIIGRWTLGKQRTQLAQLAATRPDESICQFARSFDTGSVDTWVIRAVYETLQHELAYAHSAFPLRASDTLQELFCDPDDLDMAVAPEVGRRAGRSLNDTEANPYYGKVHSVTDLVMFFNAQPRTLAN